MQRYFARDQTLTYPLCTMTVTVYHTTFNPFECRRAVLEGVHYETRRTVAVDKTGAAHSAGYLLIIPQKTAARVSPTVDTAWTAPMFCSPATVWSRARGRKSRPVRSGRRCCPATTT